MSLRTSDWKRACIAAVVLSGAALLVVFGFHPGGFETQGAWFFVLLPAGLAVYPFLDFVHKIAPRVEPVAFWTLMPAFNFLWYWVVSLIVIKIRRVLSGA